MNSPGHASRIGDKIAVEGPGGWGVSSQLGDWGVYWDPTIGRGFVWANVDHAGSFAFGVPHCPTDAAQPPNGATDFGDLRQLLFFWGAGLGPYDVDNDGEVGLTDLVQVLDAWGGCDE